MADDIPAGLRRARGRKFGLTVGGAFALLTALFAWRGSSTAGGVTGVVALLLLAGAATAPAALLPVERGWMAVAHLISRVTTPIIIGVLYFLVITPAGLIRRALGHHPLSRSGRSVWVTRAHDARRSDLTRQF